MNNNIITKISKCFMDIEKLIAYSYKMIDKDYLTNKQIIF